MTQITNLFRQFYLKALNSFTKNLNEEDLVRQTLVFAPHPDDETLGCGGTIIKKKKAGAEVNVAFMTTHLSSSSNEGSNLRAKEAEAACRILGVEKKDIVFLELDDVMNSDAMSFAIKKVTALLKLKQPDDIFIPYYNDNHFEHKITNRIVVSALQMYNLDTIIFEYPIWTWKHWPWISVSLLNYRKIMKGLSLIMLRDFRCSCYIGDILTVKKAALDQHNSQMPLLNSVSKGEFIRCFFHEHELFRRYTITRKPK